MSRSSKTLRQAPPKFLIAAVLFLLAIIAFSFLTKMVMLDKKYVFDQAAFEFFHSFTTPALADIMQVITFFGSTGFLLPAYILIVLYLLWRKKQQWAMDIVIVGLSGELMKHLLKNFFARPRPDSPIVETLKSFSFPSGHALSSFIFCSTIIYLLWNGSYKPVWRWTISIVLILFSFLIGTSRIILRYHYASDVIAGFCMGYAWVFFCLWSLDKYRKTAG
jgi:membrane-associated phospholipid phosphatase